MTRVGSQRHSKKVSFIGNEFVVTNNQFVTDYINLNSDVYNYMGYIL